MNITVVGSGYVGMSMSVLLSKFHTVKVLDVDQERVLKINKRISTVEDDDIQKALSNPRINLSATLDNKEAYIGADFIIIATPTSYDPEEDYFDMSSVDSVIRDIMSINRNCLVVIKSTLPIGHTNHLRDLYKTKNIIFSPEFLREGKALHDNYYPSRIIVGGECSRSKDFAQMLKACSKKSNVLILHASSTEAESIKLFSNTYLAMRVAFFNELDNYALSTGINARNIIEGVCLDNRIGSHYNNPSFGYGGYCLPKDTKQMLSSFKSTPQNLISAIIESNQTRKNFIVDEIIKFKPNIVGIYRLVMKKGSDNTRSSSSSDLIEILFKNNVKVLVYEPTISSDEEFNFQITPDLEDFKNQCDVIIANRWSSELQSVEKKCFTRDIFQEN
jgi:UDPglucose 6-dehydrogenase